MEKDFQCGEGCNNSMYGRRPGLSISDWFIIRLMDELFTLIEKYDIVNVGDVSKVPGLPDNKVEKLHHDLFKLIYDAQTERIWGASSAPAETFSFHASASLRGASGCTSFGCRLSKLDYLSRYAALYASELTFPLSMVRPKEGQDISVVREWLFHELQRRNYSQLRLGVHSNVS